jgi:hypothetical protein
MQRPDPIETARAIVAERFPKAVQAWLGGSVASGKHTLSSDLDITILLIDGEIRRESCTFRGWPVELFINTEKSVRYFVDEDLKLRSPATCTLVADSIPLLPGDGGALLRDYCRQILDTGPPQLSSKELETMRYTLTDMIDDLWGGGPTVVISGVAVDAWLKAAELLLESEKQWRGSNGKYLLRNIQKLDKERGSHWGEDFQKALSQAVVGSPDDLIALIDKILDLQGGRLRDGFYHTAPSEAQTTAKS